MNPIAELVAAPFRMAGAVVQLGAALVGAPFQFVGGILGGHPPHGIAIDPGERADRMAALHESVAERLQGVEQGESVPLGGHFGGYASPPFGGMHPPPPMRGPARDFNTAANNPAPPSHHPDAPAMSGMHADMRPPPPARAPHRASPPPPAMG